MAKTWTQNQAFLWLSDHGGCRCSFGHTSHCATADGRLDRRRDTSAEQEAIGLSHLRMVIHLVDQSASLVLPCDHVSIHLQIHLWLSQSWQSKVLAYVQIDEDCDYFPGCIYRLLHRIHYSKSQLRGTVPRNKLKLHSVSSTTIP